MRRTSIPSYPTSSCNKSIWFKGSTIDCTSLAKTNPTSWCCNSQGGALLTFFTKASYYELHFWLPFIQMLPSNFSTVVAFCILLNSSSKSDGLNRRELDIEESIITQETRAPTKTQEIKQHSNKNTLNYNTRIEAALQR